MIAKYVLYVNDSCPFCHKATALLDLAEEKYDLVTINMETDLFEQIKESYDWKTVPMIFKKIDKNLYRFIGGYTDLKEELEDV